MKKERQQLICRLIKEYEIETQEEMVAKLCEHGIPVTQATVSRDIRELRLTKVVGRGHRSIYAEPKREGKNEINDAKFSRVLKEAFVSADPAGTILVIKTITGMAMAVAASLDNLGWPEIVGCIAGDDTIFLATHSAQQCNQLRDKLIVLIR